MPDPARRDIDPLSITDVIAIDGPAGAGKSSVAQEVAHRLGHAYLDTGAMYRAATWWFMGEAVDMDSPSILAERIVDLPLELRMVGDTLHVIVDGRDVSEEIRTPAVTERIQKLGTIPEVRAHLVKLQRKFAASQPIVADGRDLGTVVYPAAACKIFLDASLEERTRRRVEQYEGEGSTAESADVKASLKKRDDGDRNRKTSPLKAADDAVCIDTTNLSFDEVVARILELARERR